MSKLAIETRPVYVKTLPALTFQNPTSVCQNLTSVKTIPAIDNPTSVRENSTVIETLPVYVKTLPALTFQNLTSVCHNLTSVKTLLAIEF